MQVTIQTGEHQQVQQKSDPLSSKKLTKKASIQNESCILKKLYPGDIISYYYYYGPGGDIDIKYAIVIDVSEGKKKWLRTYKILTEHTLWEKSHNLLEKDYRVEKVN